MSVCNFAQTLIGVVMNETAPDSLMPIKFGFKLPNCGGVLCPPAWARPDIIDDMAASAIAVGFDSLWLHDHLVVPGELRHLGEPDYFEPIVTMSRLAAIFPHVSIGTATIVLPFRDPVLLTKQMTTLSAFHPGRLIFGVGLGRYESEYESLGLDLYHARGTVMNASLEIMNALLSRHSVSVETPFRALSEAVLSPKRAGVGDPAIWVAGASPAGVARAARFADGLIVAAIRPEAVADLTREIGTYSASASDQEEPAVAPGHAPRLTVALSATIARARPDAAVKDESLHVHSSAIAGDADAVTEELTRYVEAGVSHFLLSFGVESIERTKDDAAWFAEQIIPKVVGARAAQPI